MTHTFESLSQFNPRWCASGATLFVLAGLFLVACSSDDEGNDASSNGAGANGGSGAGSGAGSGGANGGASGGTGGLISTGGSSGSGGSAASGGNFEECAGIVSEAEDLALDMFVVQDHTQSMATGGDGDCPLDLSSPPPDSSKWCFATHALGQYFVSDSVAGQRAALQFMAVEDNVCEGGPDNAQATAAVDLTPLPVDTDHELITTLDDDSPAGGLGTPIEAALHGIADYTAANRTAGRTMIGILVTDGDPNGCEDNIDDLAEIISDHLTETDIRTFIIGMTGATLSNLETLAEAGGAPEHGPEFCGDGVDSCHYWSVGDGDPDAFVEALQQIQAAASLPCAYEVPEAPPGEELNLDLVNVTFTDDSGNEETLFGVEDETQCDPQTGGWYYGGGSPPTMLHLCESSCDQADAASTGSSLQVVYGCEETVRPPE